MKQEIREILDNLNYVSPYCRKGKDRQSEHARENDKALEAILSIFNKENLSLKEKVKELEKHNKVLMRNKEIMVDDKEYWNHFFKLKEKEKKIEQLQSQLDSVKGIEIKEWINEDELTEAIMYDVLFPLSKVNFVRVFPRKIIVKEIKEV